MIVGSVRAKIVGDTCAVGRLIVRPEFSMQRYWVAPVADDRTFMQ